MGPTVIFDKSFLQSLNPDEAVWLDNFFISNITPLFYIETLADLEKEVKNGRTPEQVVGQLAYKTPDTHSSCNVHHRSLLKAQLTAGDEIDMTNGRTIISRGRSVTLEGESGIVVQESPEEEAFSRWQRGDFLEVERLQAKEWRSQLQQFSMKLSYDSFKPWFPNEKPKSLEELKHLIDVFIDNGDQAGLLNFGLSLLGIDEFTQSGALTRWQRSGRPPVRMFAPYFVHIFSIDLLFSLALATDLIGAGRASHRADVAYLYYLPFCNVFVSNDKLHASVVPPFLRPDQVFVHGADLKRDLAALDRHYSSYPEEVKKHGIAVFAQYPPNEDFLVSNLWDRYMIPTWRHKLYTGPIDQNDPETRRMVEKINRLSSEAPAIPGGIELDSDAADFLIVSRLVRNKKGKWRRFPPEALDRAPQSNDESAR